MYYVLCIHIYADDYDYITKDLNKNNRFIKIVKDILVVDNLKVNETKTENTKYERNDKKDEYVCKQTEDLKLCITKQGCEEKLGLSKN